MQITGPQLKSTPVPSRPTTRFPVSSMLRIAVMYTRAKKHRCSTLARYRLPQSNGTPFTRIITAAIVRKPR